jgi:hypothetical protein
MMMFNYDLPIWTLSDTFDGKDVYVLFSQVALLRYSEFGTVSIDPYLNGENG